MRLPSLLLSVATVLLLVGCGGQGTADPAASGDAQPDLGAAEDRPDPAEVRQRTAERQQAEPQQAERQQAEPRPLFFGISIHVEGWTTEVDQPRAYERHRNAVIELARTAAVAGAVLTFELDRSFVEASKLYDVDVVATLIEMGQGVAIHADVGGQGLPSLQRLRSDLVRMRTGLADLGLETTHVSGVCSRGPWVESALAAGFRSAAGSVEYCLTSLDEQYVPDGVDLSRCTSPAECHGPLPLPDALRIHPFYADSSDDFILGDAAGGLLLIVGQSGGAVDCIGEGSSGGGGCVGDADDIEQVVVDIQEYLTLHDPARVGALVYSWSVGSIPVEGFASDLFAAVAPYVGDGGLTWASLPDIADAVFAE